MSPAPRQSLRSIAFALAALAGSASVASRASAEEIADDARLEPGVVPALNYDSDIGFGFGAVGSLARFAPECAPYCFRIEAQLFMSLAIDEAGEASLPLHDDYVRADLPGLQGGMLRLGGGVFFRKLASQPYYGIGQLTRERAFSQRELEASVRARRFHMVDHLATGADLWSRTALWREPAPGHGRLEWLTGVHGSYHDLAPYPGSALARDEAARRDPARDLLGGLPSPRPTPWAPTPTLQRLHGVGPSGRAALDTGLVFDCRDHETWPTRGLLSELSARLGQAAGELESLRVHAETRAFAPLHGDWLVFASRALADAVVGEAPLDELGTFGVLDPADGLGGSRSIRGVELGRAVGAIKLVANAELRAQTPGFAIADQRFRVGFVAFADAGRAFSGVPLDPALDGPWAPFDLGVGGGLRLRWGETLVVRADGAWSPTRETPGVYVDVGQVF